MRFVAALAFFRENEIFGGYTHNVAVPSEPELQIIRGRIIDDYLVRNVYEHVHQRTREKVAVAFAAEFGKNAHGVYVRNALLTVSLATPHGMSSTNKT